MATNPVIPPKLGFFARRKKQINRWWRHFFVEEAYISAEIRTICDRYGEQVIAALLVANHAPSSEDLQKVAHDEVTRNQARAWLTETVSYTQRREHWISLRDFILEIAVILLIIFEVREGFVQDRHQSDSFGKQQVALGQLVTSSGDSVGAVKDLASITGGMKDIVGQELAQVERNVKASERSAKASEASAKIATDALHVSERAYLAGDVSLTSPPKLGEPLHFNSIASNTGRTVAKKVVVLSYGGLVPKETPANVVEQILRSYEIKQPSVTEISPGDSKAVAEPWDGQMPLTDGHIRLIENGEIRIYILQTATYQDVFGNPHSMSVCGIYDPHLKKTMACPFLNVSD